MKVHLTFDIEVWCGGWDQLDVRFPAAFDRYIFGRSAKGEYALPATLDILARYGLQGVFFVEPMFSARFGEVFLEHVVRLIESAGQQVQLHLHPEWTDEITPQLLPGVVRKRQHLHMYTLDEQRELLRFASQLLQRHSRQPITAFRAGSYAANADTYRALSDVGLRVDSSLNRASEDSWPGMHERSDLRSRLQVGDVCVFPITVFRDGRGAPRPAQVGACSLSEMRHALLAAQQAGQEHFVIVSHNFEMLKPGRSEPDTVVVRRFDGLCRHLAEHRERFPTTGLEALPFASAAPGSEVKVPLSSTLQRLVEQALRRVL